MISLHLIPESSGGCDLQKEEEGIFRIGKRYLWGTMIFALKHYLYCERNDICCRQCALEKPWKFFRFFRNHSHYYHHRNIKIWDKRRLYVPEEELCVLEVIKIYHVKKAWNNMHSNFWVVSTNSMAQHRSKRRPRWNFQRG